MDEQPSSPPEQTEIQLCLLAVNHVFQHDEIESLANAGVRFLACGVTMTRAEGDAMMREFEDLFARQQAVTGGRGTGISGLLDMSRGALRTIAVLDHLTGPLQRSPLAMLKEIDPSRLAPLLPKQPPRTIAVILGYMDPAAAAQVLTGLPGEVRSAVIRELCVLERVKASELWTIDQWLRRSLARATDEISGLGLPPAGGVDAAVEILVHADRGTEQSVMSGLESADPGLFAEIRRRMTTFEDIVRIDEMSLRTIIGAVSDDDLAHALKGTGAEAFERIMAAMPEERAGRIREEMAHLGPVVLRDVERAQGTIIAAIRALEETGDIIVARPGEEGLID